MPRWIVLSIRARLLVMLVTLTVLGMAVIDIAALFVLNAYAQQRVDNTLIEVQETLPAIAGRPVNVVGLTLEQQLPEGFFVVVVGADRRAITQTRPFSLSGEAVTAPGIPDPVPPGWAAEPTTVSSSDTSFRVRTFDLGERAAITLPGVRDPVPFRYVIVAGSMTPGRQAVTDLLVIELFATGFAVIAVCAFGVVAFNRSAHAQKKTEERLREFIAAASHELRTPLTTIRGWAELHRVSGRPELATVALSRIEQEADRMNALVDQLLQLASLDREDKAPRRDRVDLRGLAAESVADAAVLEPERAITLDAPREVFVHGDENALRQVIRNLLSNAMKHTPPGTEVSVTVRQGMLMVTDNGPGMPPDVAKRVFDRFYRAEGRTSQGGTGLGLSIVREIVQKHGGKVTVASTPDEGSTFTVFLPTVSGSSGS